MVGMKKKGGKNVPNCVPIKKKKKWKSLSTNYKELGIA